MPFKPFKYKNKYKYNDFNEVRKWSAEKIHKNVDDINPEIICDLSLENIEQFIHPNYLEDKSFFEK
jgi:hypothetical protein